MKKSKETFIRKESESEIFWLEDPFYFLLDVSNYVKIIPDKNMSLIEQLNATFRFCIIFSLMMFAIRHDVRTLLFALFGGFITVVIYKYNEKENLDKKGVLEKLHVRDDRFAGMCTKPTPQNPFMNVNLTDYTDFPNRPPACNVSSKRTQKEMEKSFNQSVFRDVDDIYGKKTSDRQFYTMPSTTIPNDQKAFAHWLYVQNAPPGKQP